MKNLRALFRLVRFLNKQTSRQRPCSTNRLSIHLWQNLICWGVSRRPDDRETEWSNGGGGGRLETSLAMHETKCWHKVTQHAEQGRQEESILPSLHLSIDIPGSPLPASGFCNYHQTAASRPPNHWLTAWINRDVEMPWDPVCLCVRVCSSEYILTYMLLGMNGVCQHQKLMSEFLCLSWFFLHISVCTVLMCSVGVSV